MKSKIKSCAITLSLTLILLPVQADEYYKPVSKHNSVTFEECSACHMAYSPEMLPQRSWETIMNNLENYFGEDASVSPGNFEQIKAYLTDNAADSGWFNTRFAHGISDENIPLRISETPYWIHEHREIHPDYWRSERVQSKSNCMACHRHADRGGYDDD